MRTLGPEAEARAARIRLVLMDVDGVLTDGLLHYACDPSGEMVETKCFHAQDGIALQWANWLGLDTGLISGRESPAVVTRARQCRMKYVRQGHLEKLPVWEEILSVAGLEDDQVAFIGDDLTDLPLLRRAGFAAAPANARPELKPLVHLVTEARGGDGAVREVIEALLRAQGRWAEIRRKYGLPET
jgi:3-deoxy-D-manno-octulosonate 8-phosphate phosphatase (KDO 8-P phosphatase)